MPKKIQIDPAHPLGSLTAGDQQFTIAGDTNHEKESIQAAINNDIPQMAKNGVKHLMIEYPAEPLAEIEKKYPAMNQAKTWDARYKVIDQHASNPNLTEKEKYQVAIDKQDLEAHQIIEGTYSGSMTNDQIREASKKFAGSTAENQEASSQNFADMLIKSRDAGIKVHFSGDRIPYELKKGLNDANDALDNHINDSGAERNQGYYDRIKTLQDNLKTAQENASEPRLNLDNEQKRVDRMIEMSNGEKSVAVWGAAHTLKANDLDEMMDSRLAEAAQKKGQPAPAATKVMELYDSKNDRDNMEKRDAFTDEPDARFYIREKEVEVTPSGSKNLELKSDGPSASGPSAAEKYAQLMGDGHVVGSVGSIKSPETPDLAVNDPVYRPSNPSFG